MPVRARCYTDPACSASWASEPKRRALQVEFGSEVSFTYVMGGLARDYEAGYSDAAEGIEAGRIYESLLVHWLERAAASRMPIDPRLWSEGPIRTTFPACMAVKAASEQGPEAGERYLRAVREGLLCSRRKLDTSEALVDVAREAGLDVQRFRIDFGSNAIVEAFGNDLEETRSPPQEARERGGVKQGQGGERLAFPSVRFDGEGGERAWAFGEAPYEAWRAAAMEAGAAPAAGVRPDPRAALERFGRMATAEVEAACDLSEQAASLELWRLAAEGRVRRTRVLTGDLWEMA
jgi:predicted DsbA family dithiol-disulfide isomerase